MHSRAGTAAIQSSWNHQMAVSQDKQETFGILVQNSIKNKQETGLEQ